MMNEQTHTFSFMTVQRTVVKVWYVSARWKGRLPVASPFVTIARPIQPAQLTTTAERGKRKTTFASAAFRPSFTDFTER